MELATLVQVKIGTDSESYILQKGYGVSSRLSIKNKTLTNTYIRIRDWDEVTRRHLEIEAVMEGQNVTNFRTSKGFPRFRNWCYSHK